MVTMKAVSNWSMADFKDIETFEDLIWWHNKTIEQYNKLNSTKE